jgi:hypothetical protein
VIRRIVIFLLVIPLTGQTAHQILSNALFDRSLAFGGYVFTVKSSPGTGFGKQLVNIEAMRGTLLLTRFQVPVMGNVIGAQVADLDHNRFPELYIFSQTTGTSSFGFVQGWQFLPQRRASISIQNWQNVAPDYMGHDSLWTEAGVLCRRFPRYNAGDANAYPSGGLQTTRYQLVPDGQNYRLVAQVK